MFAGPKSTEATKFDSIEAPVTANKISPFCPQQSARH